MFNQALYVTLTNLFLKKWDHNTSRAILDLANAEKLDEFKEKAFRHRNVLNLNVPEGVELDDQFLSLNGGSETNSLPALYKLARETKVVNDLLGDPAIQTLLKLIQIEMSSPTEVISALEKLSVDDLLNILNSDVDLYARLYNISRFPFKHTPNPIEHLGFTIEYDEESITEATKRIKNEALVIAAKTLNASISKTISELLYNDTLPTNESVAEFQSSIDNMERLEGCAFVAEEGYLEQYQELMKKTFEILQSFEKYMHANDLPFREHITKLTDTIHQFSETSTTQTLMDCYKEARMAYGIMFMLYVGNKLNPKQLSEDNPEENTKMIEDALEEARKKVTTLQAKLVREKLAALDGENVGQKSCCEPLVDKIKQFETLLIDANTHALKDAALFTGLDKLEAYQQALDKAATGPTAAAKLCKKSKKALDDFRLTMRLPEYDEAFKKLELQHDESAPSDLRTKVAKLIDDVKTYKTSGEVSIEELTSILKNTNKLLLGEMTPKRYEEEALLVQGKPSVAMKWLGGLMIAIGAIIAATLLAATGVGAFVAIGVGTAVAATSIGFFAASRQTGLSKTMSQVADAREHQSKALGA